MFMRSNDDNIEDISTELKKKKVKEEKKKLLPFFCPQSHMFKHFRYYLDVTNYLDY